MTAVPAEKYMRVAPTAGEKKREQPLPLHEYDQSCTPVAADRATSFACSPQAA
jgi:hypothetical protein